MASKRVTCKQASDLLPRSTRTGSEPVILSLLDHLLAPQKLELTRKRVLGQYPSAVKAAMTNGYKLILSIIGTFLEQCSIA